MGVMHSQGSVQERIQTILNSFHPYIQEHGGLISLVRYDSGIVYVRLEGACATCPASIYTLKLGIEEALKKEIPSIIEVVAVED